MTVKRALFLIYLLALLLRLIYGLAQDPLPPYVRGSGDSWWYLANGDALVNSHVPEGIPVDISRLPTPPGYLILLGIAQGIFEPAAAVYAVQIVQAVMGVVLCWCGWRLALRLTRRESAGVVAALIMAISPIFIIEPGRIVSETLYMLFIGVGLVAYVEYITIQTADAPEGRPYNPPPVGTTLRDVRTDFVIRPIRLLLLSAICFGLAALTRAPILLFPVGLAIHLFMVFGLRAGWRKALVLLLVYAAVVSTWTIYSAARWGRFVIAADGFASFLYLGATGWDGPEGVDRRIGSVEGGASAEVFANAAAESISADPGGYIRRRVGELASSVLQPHGTVYFPGESLRDLVVKWLRDDRSLSGLIAITRGDAFLPKALIYLFHYGALIGGVIGIWRSRKNWRVSLVLIGFILYTTLVHLVLLALPRYIFPTFIAWIVFTAAALFPPKETA